MHIPDNFLSTPVWAALDAVAAPAVVVVSRQAQRATDENRLPLLGVMGAFVFAAQMINFPVGAGTSGHLVGGTLLACVLGPWAAALVVSAILIVQALVFQDGGVLALGANVINMALLGVIAGYLPARWLFQTRWKSYGVFFGGLCSVMVSGAAALSELLISGIRMAPTLVELSLAVFFVNAVIEGAITVSVLRAIERLNPAGRLAIAQQAETESSWARVVAALAAASAAIAAGAIVLASTLPDGLEHLARDLHVPFGARPLFHSPLRNYHVSPLGTDWLSRATAGLLGLAIIYAICALGGRLLARARRTYS
jgi:cobalt/nickel transport system permease protein